MKKIFESRMAIMILFMVFYMILMAVMGFEKTMIIIGGTIIGDLCYKELNPK